jgi:hypothetical protein
MWSAFVASNRRYSCLCLSSKQWGTLREKTQEESPSNGRGMELLRRRASKRKALRHRSGHAKLLGDRRPGRLVSGARDPWLCVTASRRLCPGRSVVSCFGGPAISTGRAPPRSVALRHRLAAAMPVRSVQRCLLRGVIYVSFMLLSRENSSRTPFAMRIPSAEFDFQPSFPHHPDEP